MLNLFLFLIFEEVVHVDKNVNSKTHRKVDLTVERSKGNKKATQKQQLSKNNRKDKGKIFLNQRVLVSRNTS